MHNEWDLQAATVTIVEADTGEGGMVALAGRPDPMVEWGDSGMGRRPVVALFIDPELGGGTGRPLVGEMRLSVRVGDGALGLESRLLDRLEEVLTPQAYAALGLDVDLTWRGRPDLSSLEESGKRRDGIVEFRMTRV